MAIKVGMLGVGAFAQSFIPLFKAHPLVEEVVFCDINAEKLAQNMQKHGVQRAYTTLDDLCSSDVDAIVINTQNWLHAPQAIQALRAGKHVYSAVPTGITVDEISMLVRTVEQTGKIYMLGETSSYYPEIIFCRQQHTQGAFGHIVYAECEYYHDWDHMLYAVMKWRGGEKWQWYGGHPPMYYPTHTVSELILVSGAHMTHVSCQGFVDRANDGVYGPKANAWGNPFSNQVALFKMSDGSICRVNEFRRVGYPEMVRFSLYGTDASYESLTAGPDIRGRWLTKDRTKVQQMDDVLVCRDRVTDNGTYHGVSSVHPIDRLPRQFVGLPNGHFGSHQFLVDDFVQACVAGRQPLNNVWMAARYALPGIVAHDSAMRGGVLLEIPDLGKGPAA